MSKSKTPSRSRRNHNAFEPLFTKKEVDETRNPLLKLLKLISVRLHLTNEELGAKVFDYYTSGLPKGGNSTFASVLSNLRTALNKDSITWGLFANCVWGIFKLEGFWFKCGFTHPHLKTPVEISSSDTYDNQNAAYLEEYKKAKTIQ